MNSFRSENKKEISQIRKERLIKINTYLEQIPEDKQEGILIGLEMVAALYKPDKQKKTQL